MSQECPSGKRAYGSKGAARKALRRHTGSFAVLRAYLCDACHQPIPTRAARRCARLTSTRDLVTQRESSHMAVIVAKQTRGPGTLRSAWRDVRGVAQPNTDYVITPLLDQADIEDASFVMTLAIEASNDGVGPLDYLEYGSTFQLGGNDRNGNPITTVPVFHHSTSSNPPSFIRAMVVLPRALSIGLDISLA